jgi:hypothetical protein
VIGVVIDHDVIAVPEPVVSVVVVIGRYREKETAEAKPLPAAATQPPNMLRANRTGESSVLPRMVKVIVSVVAAGVVSYPGVILRVNVRSLRVARLITERAALTLGWRCGTRGAYRSWPVCRNVATANAALGTRGVPATGASSL